MEVVLCPITLTHSYLCVDYLFIYLFILSTDGCYRHHLYPCVDYFGLNMTVFPNMYGHTNYDQALLMAYSFGLNSMPYYDCDMLYSHMLCASLFPRCMNGTAQKICRQSCLGKVNKVNKNIFKTCAHFKLK